MSELRVNKIIPKDGIVSGATGGIIQVAYQQKISTKNGTKV